MKWSIAAVAGAINRIIRILGRKNIPGKGYNSYKKGTDSHLDLLCLIATCSDLNIQKIWLVHNGWLVGGFVLFCFFICIHHRETWTSSYASMVRGALQDLSHLNCL